MKAPRLFTQDGDRAPQSPEGPRAFGCLPHTPRSSEVVTYGTKLTNKHLALEARNTNPGVLHLVQVLTLRLLADAGL